MFNLIILLFTKYYKRDQMTEEWKGHLIHIRWREMNTVGAFGRK